jgi:hypothetical protein
MDSMDSTNCPHFHSQENGMFSTIEGERVSVKKACLYKTAVISDRMSESLNQQKGHFEGYSTGTCVAVQFAWMDADGSPVYYFGRQRGAWAGISWAPMLIEFRL